jgi:hypothetical protein
LSKTLVPFLQINHCLRAESPGRQDEVRLKTLRVVVAINSETDEGSNRMSEFVSLALRLLLSTEKTTRAATVWSPPCLGMESWPVSALDACLLAVQQFYIRLEKGLEKENIFSLFEIDRLRKGSLVEK